VLRAPCLPALFALNALALLFSDANPCLAVGVFIIEDDPEEIFSTPRRAPRARSFLECGPVHDLHMLPVSHLKNALGHEGSECPAYGREGGADILGNLGARHRKIYLVRRLPLGEFELLQQLKEQCQLRDRVPGRQHKSVVLGLPQLMTQLG
jgi:hypothetical protein